MPSMTPNKAEFKRILDTIGLAFTAQPGVPDSIVDALGVIIVSHVQDYAIFAAVKQ